MANFGQLILTNLGIQEQTKAQAGEALKFKRIAMGSGNYTGNISAITSLVSEKVSVDISKGYRQNNTYTVEGFFANDTLQTGFEWREIGLYVENSSGTEILYCYANAGNTYDYIPATEDERYSKYIRIATAIGNASNISIVEQEGILYVDTVTFNTLEEKVNSIEPSKSETGSILCLEASAELPFVGMSVYGKSEQTATTGANLIPYPYAEGSDTKSGVKFTVNNDGTITLNGTATSGMSFLITTKASQTVSLDEGKTYTFKALTTEGGFDKLYAYVSNGTDTNNYAYELGNGKTFVAVGGAVNICLVVIEGQTYSNVLIKPMLNEGSSALDYEPYTGGAPSPSPDYPQEIVNVGDGGSIALNVYGKNLLDVATTAKEGCTVNDASTGSVKLNLDNAYYAIMQLTKYSDVILKNQGVPITFAVDDSHYTTNSYFTSILLWGTRENGAAYLEASSGGGNSVTITPYDFTSVTKLELRLGRTNALHTDTTTIYSGLRLFFGKEDVGFTPYSSSQITLSTPNGLAGIPVSSGGNYTDEDGQQWLCDEVDLEKGVLIKRLGTVNLGSLSWTYNIEYDVFLAYIDDICPNTLNLICTHYKTATINSATSPDLTIYGRKTGDLGGVGVKNSNYTDATEFQSAMSGAMLLYELATPIETALTSTEIAAYKALHSNKPATTIMNDAGADMKAEYIPQAHESLVSMLLKRIEALESAMEG